MSAATYYPGSAMADLKVLVGVWRHYPLLCRPGFYRVIPVTHGFYNLPHCDAVMDDFGNLVMVKQ